MPSHPVDVHVGTRLRQRRTLLGMSQTKLASSVDLTFQQIQKYERGANRMGASRLFEFAKVLDVPVSYFFDEMPASTQAGRPIRGRGRNGASERGVGKKGFGESGTPFEPERDPLIKRETLELVRAYYKIRAAGVRGGVAKMIKALAAAEPAPVPKNKRKAPT
jgi:transcriptional regulator with XRE-family HTH domain